MTADLPDVVRRALIASVEILNGAAPWLVVSYAVAGLMHRFVGSELLQRHLGNRKISSLCKATVSGMLLPICSCGVIPIGLSLYYGGAFLGPTLAFMAATPIINPAAVLLAYGLLGPEITAIYLATGFVAPMLIGLAGNYLGGEQLRVPTLRVPITSARIDPAPAGLGRRIVSGLLWGFADLGLTVSKYIVIGVLLGGVLVTAVPQAFIRDYLGRPDMISLAGIAILGAVLYVCAVGHIPLVAALVASGAAPGVAITFLMTGAATNLPELLSIARTIGKRTAAIYTLSMVGISFLVGYLTNKVLMPGFVPVFDLDRTPVTVNLARSLVFSPPPALQYLCSVVVVGLAAVALARPLRRRGAGVKEALL